MEHIHPREQKRINKDHAVQTLTDNNIKFHSANNYIHIIINHEGVIIDYWPTTGRWKFRGDGKRPPRGFGIKSLMGFLTKVKKPEVTTNENSNQKKKRETTPEVEERTQNDFYSRLRGFLERIFKFIKRL